MKSPIPAFAPLLPVRRQSLLACLTLVGIASAGVLPDTSLAATDAVRSALLKLQAGTAVAASGTGLTGHDSLSTGDSVIQREGVTYALHIPAVAAGPHGPQGIMIFFGGYGDSCAYYQKALSPAAEDLEAVLIIPQMPWFSKPGTASEETVRASLSRLNRELAQRFGIDASLVIVAGASAGGPSACRLANDWTADEPLLALLSTAGCDNPHARRILQLVGEREVAWLGDAGRTGKALGAGRQDLFAIPGAGHEAHLRHLRFWLETEIAALRLDAADLTLQAAQTVMAREGPAAAGNMLSGTMNNLRAINAVLPATDDFLVYQNARRAELRRVFHDRIVVLERQAHEWQALTPAAGTGSPSGTPPDSAH